MDLSQEDVRRLAHLCRLHLSDEELERYAGQLTNILHEVDKVTGLNTDGAVETSQVTGLVSVMREDEVVDYGTTPDELLAQSPMPIDRHSIQINKML